MQPALTTLGGRGGFGPDCLVVAHHHHSKPLQQPPGTTSMKHKPGAFNSPSPPWRRSRTGPRAPGRPRPTRPFWTSGFRARR
eukprot:1531450-Pyramimonas_sp.AAC.1